MNSKMKARLIMFAAMAVMGDYSYTLDAEYKELTETEREQIKAIAEAKREERLKKQGVNKYFYGQNVITARNKKNADRKARNKGYI